MSSASVISSTTDSSSAPGGPTRDLIGSFAAFAVGTASDRLPPEATSGARKTLLDSLGVTLAASGTEPAVGAVVDLVGENPTPGGSTVFGRGLRVATTEAAFANGAMAHALNYDDQTPWGQHSSSSVVPAVLAVAEREQRRGRPVPGRELLTAIAVGQDLFARLRRNVGWKQDWNLSTVMGSFAATAAAGRVLGLDADQLGHAFAIASMQAGGVMETVTGLGSQLGGLYGGFPARNAVTAALLAQRGVTGHHDVLEGRTGVFAAYFGGDYDRTAMLDGLGQEFLGSYTLYKPWAAIGTAHSHLHAMLDLVTREDLSPQDINGITVFVGDCHEALCAPIRERRAPSTLLDARFSLPFLLAVAAVRRGLGVADLNQDTLRDPHVLDLAGRVESVSDPDLDWKLELPHGRIEVLLEDGRRFVVEGHDVPGSATAPLTWSDLSAKFLQCAAAAALPPTPAQAQGIVDSVQNLEVHDDLDAFFALLGPQR